MYLKELRINGFKSFANPTRLDLQRGVTAIVGPNGCGKSNIADAIRWVLGEQSAKSLRAGAMQDVIFQGTDSRKPVNLCEVSLVFTDCEEQLGTAFAEVEVTRRVLRDGGGQYYINGKQCRLRDIQRLFLDTGVGQVSYSFMLQGQIDQILSSNPAERRTIFEEAAGISRYKAQRREALSKLSHVDANLARVTDVIEEIGRQIGSLKRQAAKALRYKRIKFRLTHLDLAQSAYRLAGLRRELEESERKSTFLRAESEKLKARLESEEGGLSTKRERRNTLNEAFQEAQQAVFELRSQKETAEAQAEFAAVRLADNQRRLDEIETDLEKLDARQQELTERAAGESRTKNEQLSLFGGTDDLFKRKSEELAVIQTRLSEAETQLSRDKQALLVKEGAVTRLRSNCTTLEVDLKSYQVRHANLADEIKTLKDEAEVLAHDLEQIERTFEVRQQQREIEETRVDERRQQVSALTAEFREIQVGISENDRRLAAVVAQINVLEGLQAKLEGFSEGAKAVLQGKLESVVDPSGCDLLLKNVSVDAAYAPSLETLLGALAEGVVIKDRRRVAPVAEALREKKLGRAYLKFAAPPRPATTSGNPPADLIPALSVVSATSPDFAPLLENLLSGCYFTEALTGFLAWWEAHPEFAFDYVATPEGDLVDRRGWVLSGSQKKGNDRSFLSRANEIKKFTQERRELEASLEERRQRAEVLQEKIEKAERAVEDQRRRVMELAQEVATLETQDRNARKNVEQNARLLEQKLKELERQDTQKAESTRRLESAREQLAESEQGIESQKKAIVEGEERVTQIREQREAQRESFNDARLEIAEKKQRLELLERGLQELQAQTREVEIQRARRLQERGQLRSQNGDLQAGQEQQRKMASEYETRLKRTMEDLDRARSTLKAVEEEIDVVEKGLGAQREAYEKVSRELNTVDVALARQQAQAQHLAEEMRREYELELKTINWKQELWTAGEALPERIRVEIDDDSLDEPEPEERGDPTAEDLAALDQTDWGEIEFEIKQLRQRLQAIGAVNLVAIEEYKELNERYTFLKAQSDDLWASKDELLKAIDEINTTSKELFSNTFDQIRKNFVFTFDALFGGGHADLTLVDNEDVLESGIDIIAQPPGTRLKTLALLSGGQKTMTAVALLFAVYMVKPSPFCVLDELDAPLDDANIGRFCKMLERFLEYSQFLIITHNKRTISVADTIYGVTMQEKGVSRLLSMRFDKEKGTAEEVAVVTS